MYQRFPIRTRSVLTLETRNWTFDRFPKNNQFVVFCSFLYDGLDMLIATEKPWSYSYSTEVLSLCFWALSAPLFFFRFVCSAIYIVAMWLCLLFVSFAVIGSYWAHVSTGRLEPFCLSLFFSLVHFFAFTFFLRPWFFSRFFFYLLPCQCFFSWVGQDVRLVSWHGEAMGSWVLGVTVAPPPPFSIARRLLAGKSEPAWQILFYPLTFSFALLPSVISVRLRFPNFFVWFLCHAIML